MALVDTGSSYNFMSLSFASRLKLELKEIPPTLSITADNREVSVCREATFLATFYNNFHT